jgi:alcohol dehydrogenase (cytochrome c)
VLFDADVSGRPRKLLAQANRNGFYYVLDRVTGKFVAGTAFVKQTWANGLDPKGRPIAKEGLEPKTEGILVYPSIQGAANWHSPSYSPKTHLFYQAAVEMGTIFYKGEAVYNPRIGFTGGGGRTLIRRLWSAVRALEATTGGSNGIQVAVGRAD